MAPREVEVLTAAIQDMAHELLQIEQHCPCGARPETPVTHPHVIGCPVDRALEIWRRTRIDEETRREPEDN